MSYTDYSSDYGIPGAHAHAHGDDPQGSQIGDDYIYPADTGSEELGLPLRLWSQQGADFQGAELELKYDLGEFANGHWQLTGFADYEKMTPGYGYLDADLS